MLVEDRANHKEHTQAERQKVCEVRQKEVNNRISNYSHNAQKHLEVFNGIFTKVQNLQANKKLNAPTYDALVATATVKGTAATDAVNALKTLSVNVDCSSPDPAGALANVKVAVKNARTALHEYRLAIKDVISALSAAKVESSTTTSTAEGN